MIGQFVEPVPRRHAQAVERGHRVDLIQLSLDDRPDGSGNPPGGFAVDAVPDVRGRIVGQRPDHVPTTIAHVVCYGRPVRATAPELAKGGGWRDASEGGWRASQDSNLRPPA